VDESRLEVSFREPWLFSRRNVASISFFTELNRERDPAEPEGVIEETFRGFLLAVDHGFNTPFRLRTSFENRWTTIDSTTHEERLVTRSLSAFVQRDYRDNPFDASRGTLQSFLARYAGGSTNFVKLSLSTSSYRVLRRRLVLATRFRTGWIRQFGAVDPNQRPFELVPRSERFKAGGATSVRGYPEDSLGPQKITAGQKLPATDRGLFTLVTNVELRFPLVWRLGAAVFLDGGQVWESIQRLSLGHFTPDGDQQDYRYSAGGGVRLATPIGPLRVDYGYGLVRRRPEREIAALRNGEWHFSLGQAF
jgi:outer membrane protein assembly factor BamA